VTKPLNPHKSFVGKIIYREKQLHTRLYVKRGRWVYEGSRLELQVRNRELSNKALLRACLGSDSLFPLVAELRATKKACSEAQTAERHTIILFLSCVTTNPFLAVEVCYGPPKLGQVVVHTADVVPLTSNSEAYRGARRPVSFGMAGSVGVCGLLTDGQTYPKTFGGKLKQIAVSDVICGRYPPPAGCIQHYGKALSAGTLVWWTILWGTQWGQLDSCEAPVAA